MSEKHRYSKDSWLPVESLNALFDALRQAGYRCMGPQLRDGAIVYAELMHVAQLPVGWRDRQSPGHYRLEQAGTKRAFAWANGPQALKPVTFVPREKLWQSRQDADGGLTFHPQLPDTGPLAMIGVRACDLAALALQDRHFLQCEFADSHYAARRENLFLVAVHCTHPASTCFCASTGDGPEAVSGFDLAMHELDEGYLLQTGSDKGRKIFDLLPLESASTRHLQAADEAVQLAASTQTRALPSGDLQQRLFNRLDHPRWEETGQRCLSCGNCTSVCPTCFCFKASELPALDGSHSIQVREWDSCFNQGHSYMAGYTVRQETHLRYRQWLTHKLGSWHAQYGRSGCVGCGRCIAWCPAEIDIVEEVEAITSAD